MNILVCTPGRLLQRISLLSLDAIATLLFYSITHAVSGSDMDQTPNFDCVGLKMLVIDEADRILDMGFQKTVNAIIENLPKERYQVLSLSFFFRCVLLAWFSLLFVLHAL